MSDQTIFCVAPAGFDDIPRHAFIELASRRCSREVAAAARNRPPVSSMLSIRVIVSGPCRSASSLAMVKTCLDAGGCRTHDRCGGVGTCPQGSDSARSLESPQETAFPLSGVCRTGADTSTRRPCISAAASRTISTIGCPADGLFPIEAFPAQDLTYHRVPIALGLFQTLTVCNAAERFSQRVHR